MGNETLAILINNGIEVGALLLSSVISYLLIMARNKFRIEKQLEQDIMAAIDVAYTGFVRPLKRDLEGESMSIEDKNEARRIAMEALINLGETKGLDYIKKYGIKVLGSMIEAGVKKVKN